MKRLAKILALVLLVVVGFGVFKTLAAPSVTTRAADPDYFYGFNTPFLPFDTANNIAAELGYLPQCTQASANSVSPQTMRVFLPSSGVSDLEKLFANSPSNINYIVTLSNYWGAGSQGPACSPNPPYNNCQVPPTKWYQDNSTASSSFQQYVKTVVSKFKSQNKVFMWEIMNEPSCDSDPACSSARQKFIEATANNIKSSGGAKLISPGLQGNMPDSEYAQITNISNVSANTCHMYPETASENDPEIQNCINKMDIVKDANKVFYIGEIGFNINSPSCTPQGVTSETIKRAQDLKKIEAIFTTDRSTNENKADGFLMWRFDPPQSGPQTCDPFSVFPGDPICGGAGGFNYVNPPGSDSPSSTPVNPNGSDDYMNNYKAAYYPPLGSLQACPSEVPVDLIPEPLVTLPTGLCNIKPKDEPASCRDPKLASEDQDFCHNAGDSEYCWPDSCKTYWKNDKGEQTAQFCNANSCDVEGFGRIIRAACLGTGRLGKDDLWYQSFQNYKAVCVDKTRSATDEDIHKIQSDQDKIAYCIKYFQDHEPNWGKPKQVVKSGTRELPVCVPTKSNNGRCTTTCGTPLKVNALLQMTNLGTCTSGDCAANINFAPGSNLFAPLAEKLANYFAGTFDAGGVGDGYISKEDLARIKEEVGQGNSQSINAMFAQAGVAKKLLPVEMQDTMKCQFINYVKDKVAKFADEKTRENTKYIYLKDGEITEFKINDIPVSQIQMPPFVDPQTCQVEARDKGETDQWSQTASGIAWADVPIFDNEDSQGAIEFVSSSPEVTKPESIKTSIPEIKRLYTVTRVLQNLLMPAMVTGSTLPTPVSLGLTIGPEIKPAANALACNITQTLKDIYGDKKGYALESDKEAYGLGVDCVQNNGDLPKDPDSTSQVCSVGTDGQINCTQVAEAGTTGIREFSPIILQTRNVQPYLFDVFLQTIESSRGLLRIFKPEYLAQQGDSSLETRDQFEENYKPLPAESNKVQFEIQSVKGGITLDEEAKKNGWMLLFDKIGGVWNAQQFVLQLLQPKDTSSTNDL